MTKKNNLNIQLNIAQFNPSVGDFAGNLEKILAFHSKAKIDSADIVIFPELAICGYPPEDLILRPAFIQAAKNAILNLAKHTKNAPSIIIGGINKKNNNIYNAAFFLHDGKIAKIAHKVKLPNYSVFDEKRLFSAAKTPSIIEFEGFKIGLLICEDMWHEECAKYLNNKGVNLIISINASPFIKGKNLQRLEFAKNNAAICQAPLIYVNQVGGQDELVFDGGSFAIDKKGKFLTEIPQFLEEMTEIKFNIKNNDLTNKNIANTKIIIEPKTEELESIYGALKLALKDYVEKNHFSGVVLGMSGGIDSALTAVIAAQALGKDRIKLVMLPSLYTSKESICDASECAKLIGAKLETINIEDMVITANMALNNIFHGTKQDTTEENIQSRSRSLLLMAISNKFNYMLLTTGNKSEMAVGYATIYGDMCGGYNILKDLYKTEVFALANFINSKKHLIPTNIITKPPSAELRPNQKDQDSLPPYEILDQILKMLVEQRLSSTQTAAHGFDLQLVEKIAKLVKLGEYKRRQAPIGAKISNVSFGKDWRYPVTHDFMF